MLLSDYSNQKEVYMGLYMKCYHTYYTFMCKNDSCCITIIMTHSIAVPESLFIADIPLLNFDSWCENHITVDLSFIKVWRDFDIIVASGWKLVLKSLFFADLNFHFQSTNGQILMRCKWNDYHGHMLHQCTIASSPCRPLPISGRKVWYQVIVTAKQKIIIIISKVLLLYCG